MLEYIRSSAQSLGVKIAFGVIILVFVFWGVGNFNDRDYSNVVAVVNGQPIVALEFEKAYRNAEEYIMRNNPGISREDLAREHLGRQVLRDLIQSVLLAQEAERAGIQVTPVELRRAVGDIKSFQDENGRFDPDAYQRVLAAQRISPAEYERDLANGILGEKMFALVTAPAWVGPEEALNRYNFLRERRILNYIFLPANKYIDDVKVADGEIRDWYDSHQADFSVPAQVDVEYIAVAPEALVDRSAIGEEKAKAWYESHKEDFETQERVRAAHILVQLAEDADEAAQKAANEKMAKIRAELAAGKPFSSVADEYNEAGAAGPGGELGWISRGQTVAPFEEAAFNLTPGMVSEIVRSPFGLHLILVEEKETGGIRPFADVEEDIYKVLAADEGQEKIHDVLDTLIEDNILQKPLAESAQKFGLKSENTGLLDKAALMEKLGINSDAADSLLSLAIGGQPDTALEAGDKYIVARIVAAEAASVRPFEDVRNEISAALKSEKALREAVQEAEKLLEKVKNEPFDQNEAVKLDIKTSQPVERGGVLADFAPDRNLNEAIFTTMPGHWLSTVFTESDPEGAGALIARVDKVVPPEAGEFENVAGIMASAAVQERKDALYSLFIQNLINGAKVEIANQNLIDRVNM